MRVAVLPEVTSGWRGSDVTGAEAFLWPDEFKMCPACGAVFRRSGRRKYCSAGCKRREERARRAERIGRK